MLENALYPDNPNRASRAGQLANDCAMFSSELSQKKAAIDEAIGKVDETFRKAFKAAGGGEVPRVEIRLARSWVFEAVPAVAGITTTVLVERAIEQAYVRHLLAEGRIGEAAFNRLFRFPNWFKIGKFGGGLASGAVATLVLQLGIDALDGANQRSKLQEAISSLATPRFRLKRAIMVNQTLISSLQGMSSAYAAQERFLARRAGLTDAEKQATLTEFTQAFVEETRASIAEIDNAKVLAELTLLDKDRNAWTAEDATADMSVEQASIEEAVVAALHDTQSVA